jgi:hypothetical protein
MECGAYMFKLGLIQAANIHKLKIDIITICLDETNDVTDANKIDSSMNLILKYNLEDAKQTTLQLQKMDELITSDKDIISKAKLFI